MPREENNGSSYPYGYTGENSTGNKSQDELYDTPKSDSTLASNLKKLGIETYGFNPETIKTALTIAKQKFTENDNSKGDNARFKEIIDKILENGQISWDGLEIARLQETDNYSIVQDEFSLLKGIKDRVGKNKDSGHSASSYPYGYTGANDVIYEEVGDGSGSFVKHFDPPNLHPREVSPPNLDAISDEMSQKLLFLIEIISGWNPDSSDQAHHNEFQNSLFDLAFFISDDRKILTQCDNNKHNEILESLIAAFSDKVKSISSHHRRFPATLRKLNKIVQDLSDLRQSFEYDVVADNKSQPSQEENTRFRAVGDLKNNLNELIALRLNSLFSFYQKDVGQKKLTKLLKKFQKIGTKSLKSHIKSSKRDIGFYRRQQASGPLQAEREGGDVSQSDTGLKTSQTGQRNDILFTRTENKSQQDLSEQDQMQKKLNKAFTEFLLASNKKTFHENKVERFQTKAGRLYSTRKTLEKYRASLNDSKASLNGKRSEVNSILSPDSNVEIESIKKALKESITQMVAISSRGVNNKKYKASVNRSNNDAAAIFDSVDGLLTAIREIKTENRLSIGDISYLQLKNIIKSINMSDVVRLINFGLSDQSQDQVQKIYAQSILQDLYNNIDKYAGLKQKREKRKGSRNQPHPTRQSGNNQFVENNDDLAWDNSGVGEEVTLTREDLQKNLEPQPFPEEVSKIVKRRIDDLQATQEPSSSETKTLYGNSGNHNSTTPSYDDYSGIDSEDNNTHVGRNGLESSSSSLYTTTDAPAYHRGMGHGSGRNSVASSALFGQPHINVTNNLNANREHPATADNAGGNLDDVGTDHYQSSSSLYTRDTPVYHTVLGGYVSGRNSVASSTLFEQSKADNAGGNLDDVGTDHYQSRSSSMLHNGLDEIDFTDSMGNNSNANNQFNFLSHHLQGEARQKSNGPDLNLNGDGGANNSSSTDLIYVNGANGFNNEGASPSTTPKSSVLGNAKDSAKGGVIRF